MELYKLLEQKENGDGKMYKVKETVLRNSVVCTIEAYDCCPLSCTVKDEWPFIDASNAEI